MELFKRLITMVIIFVLCAGLVSARPMATGTATITVTISADEYADPGPGTGCSLREAIKAADDHASYGGCTYSGSGDPVEITLSSNTTYTLNGCAGVDSASCGDIETHSNIIINGGGRLTTIINANYHNRIFNLIGDGDADYDDDSLTLNDLSLIRGKTKDGTDGADGSSGVLNQDGGTGTNGVSADAGGAIITYYVPLTLNRVALHDNSTGDGGDGGNGGNGGSRDSAGDGHTGGNGGNGGYGGSGGAIYSYNAPVSLTNCLIFNNYTGLGGSGGNGGNGEVGSANTAADPGAGGSGGDAGYGNTSGNGGAIYIESGLLTVTSSLFYSNSTSSGGIGGSGGNGAGGVAGTAATDYKGGDGGDGGDGNSGQVSGVGGAISAGDSSSVVIVNSKFYQNSTGNGGQGGLGGSGGGGGAGGDSAVVSSGGNAGGDGGDGGNGGNGNNGGSGGAIWAYQALSVSGSEFYENEAGNGGTGGNGNQGGDGGAGGSSPNSAAGGNGGNGGNGNTGGYGGSGGAIIVGQGSLTLVNSAIYSNIAGHAAKGGAGGAGGSGGAGGDSTTAPGGTGGTGGAGGYARGGGNGGYGGGLQTGLDSDKSMILTNTTFSTNGTGAGADGSNGGSGGTGGDGGDGPGPTQTANGGPGGAGGNGASGTISGYGGGISLFNPTGSTNTLTFLTIYQNTTSATYGSKGTGGTGGAGGEGSDGTTAASGGNGEDGYNSSRGLGGGLFSSTGTVSLQNNLVAGNMANYGLDCFGTFTSLGYNLVADPTSCTITLQGNDLSNLTASPLNLGALANNGGTTKTHAVLDGSVALDHIPYQMSGCGKEYATDQRGVKRPYNNACEIGAFEVFVNTPPVGTPDTYSTPSGSPLTVDAANGLLDNDTDVDADPLVAELVTGPSSSQGTLILSTDGSFTFTPAAAFWGDATFTYAANDGTDSSSAVLVTIHVTALYNYIPLIVGP